MLTSLYILEPHIFCASTIKPFSSFKRNGRKRGDQNMVRKDVIPAGGLGTRLFPATKEQPKEMLSIFSQTVNGDASVKPRAQVVFEQLYDAGLREFCYVVGRGKRA
jgi:UTP--glucose-1-phosphate uridylyltransferase